MGDNIVHGPTSDTAAGDVVIINVNPDGPYGVNLVPDVDGFAAVIRSFDRLPNGKFGPLQKHGGLHYGDVLFEINNTPLGNITFVETMKIINDRNILKKAFKFVNSKEYYRRKKATSMRAPPQDGKNNFMSTIKRSRISEAGSKKYVEFEVACQLIAVSTKVQKEIVYQWSVWKRYSEFEALHVAIKRSLGWQMDGIDVPSAHTFVMNKLSPEFIEQRRNELSEYWTKVVGIDKITDFHKHHCSADLREFLDVEANTRKVAAPTADLIDDGGNEKAGSSSSSSSAAGAAPSRRGSVRSIRRKASSQLSGTGFNYDDDTPPPSEAVVGTGNSSSSSNSASSSSRKAAGASAEPDQGRVPPVPPPRPAAAAPQSSSSVSPASAAAASTAAPAAASGTGGSLPPKATGARANLLGSISALRKD